MKIPFVIDNIHTTMADALNDLLEAYPGQQLDVATGYFSVRGYQHLRHTLPQVGRFRLLLGDSPADADDVGLGPDSAAYLRHELNAEPLSEEVQRLVEELVRFLRREEVEVRLYLGYDPSGSGRRRFLHAKCYLFYGGGSQQLSLSGLLNPFVGIVGSSNFTGPGLTSNRELNLVHKTLLEPGEVDDPVAGAMVAFHAEDPAHSRVSASGKRLLKSEVGARAIDNLVAWYDAQWRLSVDFKADLIELLENSKFGGREYTPYEIYMKALYEYFRDDLDTDFSQDVTRSAVELSEFQEDAVKKARRILARYDGVIVADSVGLGKTWIGKKLLEDYAYHLRQKAVVICPASLRAMWEEELRSATIAATVISQESLGMDGFDFHPFADADVILVDEAHNFRNRLTKRYQALETMIAANGRRGRGGGRKKLILLTATPINNNIFDLYNQINLFAGNDRTYFAAAGIGDLYRYFLAARRDSIDQGSIRIFNLLEEVVIRRTRQFIRKAYPEATIGGKQVTWPERRLRTVRYDLEATYEGIYTHIVRRIESLKLPHYSLETYRVDEENLDTFELGRQQALVGIFKSRFLKRFESSIDAFRISIHRALEFAKTYDEYLQDGIILDSSSFRQAMRLVAADTEDDEGNGIPRSQARNIDDHMGAREIVEELPRLTPEKYDRRALHHDLAHDIESLTDIWYRIKDIGYQDDAKLQRFKELLRTELRGEKVLVFSYYKDTARYLYQALTQDENAAWLEEMGSPNIRRIDSGASPKNRVRLVELFAPRSQGRDDLAGTDQEIEILISTDVLSEGQNLQDCGHLINYDLHWNPTRMVQRAGRIDRLGSPFETLTIYNMFPEEALENLLGLVRSLTQKIDIINQTGFLDASVLGEVVTPRDFNTLRRIADEDDSVIDEQESFLELASSEAMLAELQKVLATEAREWITDLDDGIHSGLRREGAQGVFFYFKAPHPEGGSHHFWRYYDLKRRDIIDNRYQIMQLIACGPETPRFPPPYDQVDIYRIQDKIIQDIMGGVERQQAASLVSKPVAEEQAVAAQILARNLSHPDFDRTELKELRKFLRQPMVGASVKRLREALKKYRATSDLHALVDVVQELYEQQGESDAGPADAYRGPRFTRGDLHLVCYEYICL